MAINQTTLSGNLTRDAELKNSQGGTSVLKFGIAVNDRIKRGDVWEDYPNFIDCTMFGKRAESIAQYLTKGTKVCINGRLHYSSWQGQDGSKHSKIDVIVNDIEFMNRSQNQSNNAPSQNSNNEMYSEDEIPF